MAPQLKSLLKVTAAVLLAAVATGFVIARFNSARRTGEENGQVWFYDESEKRLYPVAGDTLPPHKGIGGRKDDGVRAIVVAFRGEQSDPRKRRIAYLQTYTAELKALLESVRAARAAGRPFKGGIPSRDSDFFQTNTLVKAPDDDLWHPSSSAEGQNIMSAWRSWRGPDGQPPVVCVP
jgi:hypothetical protein